MYKDWLSNGMASTPVAERVQPLDRRKFDGAQAGQGEVNSVNGGSPNNPGRMYRGIL
jgi:hypothetical protein